MFLHFQSWLPGWPKYNLFTVLRCINNLPCKLDPVALVLSRATEENKMLVEILLPASPASLVLENRAGYILVCVRSFIYEISYGY